MQISDSQSGNSVSRGTNIPDEPENSVRGRSGGMLPLKFRSYMYEITFLQKSDLIQGSQFSGPIMNITLPWIIESKFTLLIVLC